MPVECEIRGAVLALAVIGVVRNEEIERALGGALADPQCRPVMRLLWDGRRSQTPVSRDDIEWRIDLVQALALRGRLSRVALLGRVDQRLTIDLGRKAVAANLLSAVSAGVFTDESDAIAWLEQ